MTSAPQQHWQSVYRDKTSAQTSWFCPHLDMSLRLIGDLERAPTTAFIDVGGGRSTLVDDLIARGFSDITVLDIAESALAESASRLGSKAAHITWLVADITATELPVARYGLWHDRAVFHFLVDEPARRRYVEQASRSLRPGGHLIIATFAADGPERCSGLAVRRYGAETLAAQFVPDFERVADRRDLHRTPRDSEQAFTYVVLRRKS